MITIIHKGDFKKTHRFLTNAQKLQLFNILNRYGAEGLLALSAHTPKDTGKTSLSWRAAVEVSNKRASLKFFNDNTDGDTPIVILLQYGHATRRGGWVQGRDFINPAIQPIFDRITEAAWKEVVSL